MYFHKKNVAMICSVFMLGVLFLLPGQTVAANYQLEIIQPQPNLNTNNRYYKAYPGLEYKVPIGVFGGSYPFIYELTSAPLDMTIDRNTGIVTWNNPSTLGSPYSVTVQVTDNESNTDRVSWTVTVTTTGFIFVDAVNGTHSSYNGCSSSCGDGSIGNPFLDLGDVYAGSTTVVGENFEGVDPNTCTTGDPCYDTTYDNYSMYLRGGTYAPKGDINNNGAVDVHIDWRVNKPMIWLEHPGETVIVDHDYTGASYSGAHLQASDGTTGGNYFFHGIKFQDMLNNGLYFFGTTPNEVIFDCEFENMTAGTDGANPGFIMEGGNAWNNTPSYHLIAHNTFTNAGGGDGCYIKLYSQNKTVISDNSFSETTAVSNLGIDQKAYIQYTDVRANTFNSIAEHVIGGSMNLAHDMEIRYNLVLDADGSYSGGGDHGALVLNEFNSVSGPVYIYRNTFDGTVSLKNATNDDGPFYMSNNIIINENAGIDDPDGSYIVQEYTSASASLILSSSPNNDLVGSVADGIIDEHGNLTNNFSSYLGTHGHQLGTYYSSILNPPQSFGIGQQ